MGGQAPGAGDVPFGAPRCLSAGAGAGAGGGGLRLGGADVGVRLGDGGAFGGAIGGLRLGGCGLVASGERERELRAQAQRSPSLRSLRTDQRAGARRRAGPGSMLSAGADDSRTERGARRAGIEVERLDRRARRLRRAGIDVAQRRRALDAPACSARGCRAGCARDRRCAADRAAVRGRGRRRPGRGQPCPRANLPHRRREDCRRRFRSGATGDRRSARSHIRPRCRSAAYRRNRGIRRAYRGSGAR